MGVIHKYTIFFLLLLYNLLLSPELGYFPLYTCLISSRTEVIKIACFVCDRLGRLLTCTQKGKNCVRSIAKSDDAPSNQSIDSPSEWTVTNGGQVLCSSLDPSENYALFGGKRVELNLWNLNNSKKIWAAKPLRLYDIASQKRAVTTIDFREAAIKAVREDTDGHTVYVGTEIGDLASFDMRTGRMVGCYKGKCSGSIRSIVKHQQLPLIASCGLDSYLRIWDTNKRQLLSAVFLKQHLTSVVIDSHFTVQELGGTKPEQLRYQSDQEEGELEDKERSHKSKKKR